MALTEDQIITLSVDIENNTDPIVVNALAAGDNNTIQTWYNGQAVPDFWVLRSIVTKEGVISAMDWAAEYTQFKDDMEGISFLLQDGEYNPRAPNAREALNVVFSGASNTKTGVLGVSVREASYAEKLYAETTTGPGGGDGSSQAQSAIAVFEGNISLQDVRDAVALI